MEQEQLAGIEPTWAMIELFGHNQIAGKLSTITLGGSVLLCLDVPETMRKQTEHGYDQGHRYRAITEITTHTPAFRRLLGVGAIYAINPCTEQVAHATAARIDVPETQKANQIETRTELPPPDAIEVDYGEPPRLSTTAGEQDHIGQPACGRCGSKGISVEFHAGHREIYCDDCGFVEEVVEPSHATAPAAEPNATPESGASDARMPF